MAAFDLITNARAREALPSAAAAGADDTAITSLVTACSHAIHRYCRRIFTSQEYDEFYSGDGSNYLTLRHFPLISVAYVRRDPTVVLKVKNDRANTPIAKVRVQKASLLLTRTTAGSTATDGTLAYATYPTMTTLADAVNALTSWDIDLTSTYAQWPSADLYCPDGITGSNDPGVASQGDFNAASQWAGLKIHISSYDEFTTRTREGRLVHDASDQWDLEYPAWPEGTNNLRVYYTAGFATIPQDIQEACS